MRTLLWITFLTLAVLPLLAGWAYAGAYSLGLTGLLSEGFTLEHWRAVWSDAAFWQSLGFSAWVAAASTGIATLLALAAAIAWQRDFLKGWLSYAIYLPLTAPAIVVGFFAFQLLSKGGLLSRLSYHLGLTDSLTAFPDWVNDPLGVGIIAAHVWMATPFFVLLFVNFFETEQLSPLGQVARTLGAGRAQVVWRVFVPVLLRKASPTLLLYAIFMAGAYDIPLLLGAQSPQMISVLAIRKLQRFDLGDVPHAYTLSFFFVAAVVLLLIFLKKQEAKWVQD